MADRFTSALLAALNDSVEVKESDWNSIAEVLRAPKDAVEAESEAFQSPNLENRFADFENRFAATVSCYMAKIRAAQ